MIFYKTETQNIIHECLETYERAMREDVVIYMTTRFASFPVIYVCWSLRRSYFRSFLKELARICLGAKLVVQVHIYRLT